MTIFVHLANNLIQYWKL